MPAALIRVALTGGIATGKSHCLARFAALGAPVVDADELAHAAVAPGTAGLAAIVARFGSSILNADRSLDRDALARLVFADAMARRDLEQIVHPLVYAAIERWFVDLAAGTASLGIADIPLLFETKREGDFDVVIVAACRAEQQLDRLIHRRGYSETDARRRIEAQAPIETKIARADYVVDTSGSVERTDAQVGDVWRKLTERR